MTIDDALTVVITGCVYVCVAALLAAILVANLYVMVHAWRSDRFVWATAISVLFLTGVGGGVATALYLVLHYYEPMPPSAGMWRRAPA